MRGRDDVQYRCYAVATQFLEPQLHCSKIVVVGQRAFECVNALDPAGQRDIAELLVKEFPSATVVAVGRTALFDEFFQRVLHVKEAETASGDVATGKTPVATPT